MDLGRCADTLLKVLQLMTGRFEVTAVFDLFENEDLAERVGLDGSELEDIRYWIAELGVHWGIDGEDHKTHCGVNFEEYSWKPALDRLILGYAVAERDSEQALDAVIPFDSAEGQSSVIIGNFVRFMQMLFEKREILLRNHDLEKWCDILSDLTGQLFSEGTGNYQELAALRRTFAELRASAEMFAVREKLDFQVIAER